MATQTPNIGLTLPIGTEHLSRSIVNNNNTIIDTKMGAVGNTDLQTQMNGKVNTSDIANNLTTTTAGKVLDARQGKALSDQIGNLRHLAPKSIVTGISIANNDTFAIGSVVVCNIRFATTQAINANNVIMALPAPRNSNSSGASSSLVGVMLKKTDGTEYNASVLMEGNVYLTEQIPSGVNCLLSIVYAAKESSITSFIGS